MVNVRGEDIALLKKYAAQLKEEIYKISGIVDLEVTLEQDIPEFRLTVDRERAVDAGLMDRGHRSGRRCPGGRPGGEHI